MWLSLFSLHVAGLLPPVSPDLGMSGGTSPARASPQQRGRPLGPCPWQCKWRMLCCCDLSILRKWTLCSFFCFWCRIQEFPQNLARAPHCHGSWGFTSLYLVIWRLWVGSVFIFKYAMWVLSGMCLFRFGLVFLKEWIYFECHKWIKALNVSDFYLLPNPNTNAIVNNVYSA